MAKFNVSAALVAAILPFGKIITEGSGKLWDASRDAFILATAEFPDPSDAAKAVSTVITVNLKGNAGSARAYLSTLVWLVKNGHKPEGLSMGQATDLRYPKALKPGQPGYKEEQAALAAKKDADAVEKAEAKAKAEAEATGDPVRAELFRTLAESLARLDNSQLAMIVPEVLSMAEALTAEAEISAEEEAAEEEAESIAA